MFSFLPPVRFEIFIAGFSSRISIFPLVHWLKNSDYSSLDKIILNQSYGFDTCLLNVVTMKVNQSFIYREASFGSAFPCESTNIYLRRIQRLWYLGFTMSSRMCETWRKHDSTRWRNDKMSNDIMRELS